MEKYLVGGAVRDQLLGIPNQDKDWVVVGSSPEEMIYLGFYPVGKDFPVFLHPKTKEEYALARTERKTGHGYGGFSFYTDKNITLEQDLSRRDLTINAMAFDKNGTLIDPFNGKSDLQNGILRHVSAAFIEDPLRVLRVARFAARYHFDIAPETMQLMQEISAGEELLFLSKERVWQELSRGLMEKYPHVMIEVLYQCGALAKIMPEVYHLFGVPQRVDYHPEIDCGVHTLMVLEQTAQMKLSLEERYASLCHDLGKATTPKDILPKHIMHEHRGEPLVKQLNQRLQVPKKIAQLAQLVTAQHGNIHKVLEFKVTTILKVLERCDAFRRPQRFIQLLNVCEADAKGRLGFEYIDYPQKYLWQQYLEACLSLNITQLIKEVHGDQIAVAIHFSRLNIIKETKKRLSLDQ